jgi:hypothetical protein
VRKEEETNQEEEKIVNLRLMQFLTSLLFMREAA